MHLSAFTLATKNNPFFLLFFLFMFLCLTLCVFVQIARTTNITWPPPQEDTDIPTACPLFYAPPSKVEAEIEKKHAAKQQTEFEREYFADESKEVNMDEVLSFYSDEFSLSGRKSASDCVEILTETLESQKLVEDVVRAASLKAPSLIEKTTSAPQSTTSCPQSDCCQENPSCALMTPTQYTPITVKCQIPTKVENAVPQKWESSLTQAARTTAPDPDTFCRIPSRAAASPMAAALSIAPAEPFNPLPHSSLDPVPLPEETEPYFPPEHPIIPTKQEDEEEQVKKKAEMPPPPKPYSPFVKALEIAPERPFTPVGLPLPVPPVKKKPKDPLDELLNELPRPTEKLDMRTALTTAPDRPYTPIIPEHTSSSETEKKKEKYAAFDKSQLTKPLKPEELPVSFQMNKQEPKPPSYYSPAEIEERIRAESQQSFETRENQEVTEKSIQMTKQVIEEQIKAETQETFKASENKETKIIETETIQPAQVSQQIVTAYPQEIQNQQTSFAPIFQGFTCSFKNKTDHSQFSVEVCTTPPVLSPPPKAQTPISYIATVEERPACITREKVIQEKSGVQQTSARQQTMSREIKEERVEERPACITGKNIIQEKSSVQQTSARQQTMSREIKEQRVEKREVQKQKEEVIQVKPVPVTTMLHKPEGLPGYQLDLQATAEAELLLLERKRRAEERIQQQKKEKEERQKSEMLQHNKPSPVEIPLQQQTNQDQPKSEPKQPPPSPVKPIITIESGDSNHVASKSHFQPVLDDKPQSRTFSPRPRSITPSMINKAPPVLPYYQENLVPHFHGAIETNIFDPAHPEISRSPSPYPGKEPQHVSSRSPSPFPAKQERAKSPAPGPPPNPLTSSKSLPTPEDSKVYLAKESLKTHLPDYKSQRDAVEQQRGMDFYKKNVDVQENDYSQVSQNVACPTGPLVQRGNVHQEMRQHHQVADSQKYESQVSQAGYNITKKNIQEKTHQEQLVATNKAHSQTTARSVDGLTQIQRNKMVTEQFERSHKESNIQIETSISTKSKYPFTNVNVPVEPPQTVQSFHITDPHHISRPAKSKEICNSKLDTEETLQQASTKLTNECQISLQQPQPPASRQVDPTPPQPPVRKVFPPGSLAPIKHVAPPGACPKPSENVTKAPKPDVGTGSGRQSGGITAAPKRGRGLLNTSAVPGSRVPLCGHCHGQIRGPFITALGKIWCPQHFVCATPSCRRPLQDLGFVEEKGQLYCEYCFEQYLAPPCAKCGAKIKGDCLKAIGKNFHPECFNCVYCGKLFGNNPFFLEDGNPYCEADWNELFTTKCFACGFPVEAGDRWVEALNNNYHSQCFNCTMCKKNLEGQSFFAKGGRPFCKNHAR